MSDKLCLKFHRRMLLTIETKFLSLNLICKLNFLSISKKFSQILRNTIYYFMQAVSHKNVLNVFANRKD